MKNPAVDKIKLPAALWEGLKRVGLSHADVVRAAKLPINVIRNNASITTQQFFALWRALADVSGDPVIGLRLVTKLDDAVMPPSFLAAYHARDFRDALQRAARFKRLCAPEDIHIEEQADRCDILVDWIRAQGQATPPALIDATFVSLVELGRAGTQESLTPIAVELARPECMRTVYEQYFGCRVQFSTKTNRLCFHRTDLDKPFASYNAELLDLLIPELDRRLEQQLHQATLIDQIGWVLRRRFTAGRPDIRSVATELAMSKRSLQRKLTEEGLTFQGILSETRHQLALDYLANPTFTIIEVAYMLGYEDHNSFFRAFRQWESLTPSAWRTNHHTKNRHQIDSKELAR